MPTKKTRVDIEFHAFLAAKLGKSDIDASVVEVEVTRYTNGTVKLDYQVIRFGDIIPLSSFPLWKRIFRLVTRKVTRESVLLAKFDVHKSDKSISISMEVYSQLLHDHVVEIAEEYEQRMTEDWRKHTIDITLVHCFSKSNLERDSDPVSQVADGEEQIEDLHFKQPGQSNSHK